MHNILHTVSTARILFLHVFFWIPTILCRRFILVTGYHILVCMDKSRIVYSYSHVLVILTFMISIWGPEPCFFQPWAHLFLFMPMPQASHWPISWLKDDVWPSHLALLQLTMGWSGLIIQYRRVKGKIGFSQRVSRYKCWYRRFSSL